MYNYPDWIHALNTASYQNCCAQFPEGEQIIIAAFSGSMNAIVSAGEDWTMGIAPISDMFQGVSENTQVYVFTLGQTSSAQVMSEVQLSVLIATSVTLLQSARSEQAESNIIQNLEELLGRFVAMSVRNIMRHTHRLLFDGEIPGQALVQGVGLSTNNDICFKLQGQWSTVDNEEVPDSSYVLQVEWEYEEA